MTDKDPRHIAPFSRMIEVAKVGDAGQRLSIEADEAERQAVRILNGLVGLDRLSAEFRLTRDGRTGLVASGKVTASLRRTCVVTLDDFDTEIVEPVEIHFLPEREVEALAAAAAARSSPAESDPDEPDLPDPIVNGRIDLGALVAECLALGLDPYPKKPGASFAEPVQDGAVVSPFAALARLKEQGQA